MTQFAIVLPRCIVSESVLSFIGLGVSPETPTWGLNANWFAQFWLWASRAVQGDLGNLLRFGRR